MTTVDPADLPLILNTNYQVLENMEIIVPGTGYNPPFCIQVAANHCTVRNCHISGAPRIGIGMRTVSHALVDRCHVEQSGMQGIWCEKDCDGANFMDCRVINSGKDNYQIAGSNGSVFGCRSEGAGSGQPNYAGIYVATGARRIMIANNVCTGNGTGIDMSWGYQDASMGSSGGPDPSCGMAILGNRCFQNNGGGIACASNGTIIMGNQCLDNGKKMGQIPSNGIGLVNAIKCIITDNQMGNSETQFQQVGLLFVVNGASANMSKYCVIDGNSFSKNLVGSIRQFFAGNISPVPAIAGHIYGTNYGI